MEIRVARSAIETIRRAAAHQPAGIDIHDQATGGILIGRFVSDDLIEIVAATEPGPAPDNRQLGFALDLAHANSILEGWFERAHDIDVVGSWHIHPSVIERPTIGDREATYGFLAGDFAGNGYVSLIALGGRGVPAIRGFYLTRPDAEARRDFTATTYTEFDDGTHANAEDTSKGGARQYVEPVVAVDPRPARQPAPPEPVRLAPPGAVEPVRPWRAILLTLLVFLVLGVTTYFLLSGRGRGGQIDPATPINPTIGTTATIAPAAVVTETAMPVGGTEEPTPLPVVPEATVTAAATSNVVATAGTTSVAVVSTTAAAQTAVAASPTLIVNPALPYTLRVTPMDTAATAAFQERARKLDCATCYNIDITGPVPYQDLRIRLIGDNRPPLRNYEVPALALLPPRSTPYTLQVFDLKGKEVSPQVPVSVTEGNYLILAIEATKP